VLSLIIALSHISTAILTQTPTQVKEGHPLNAVDDFVRSLGHGIVLRDTIERQNTYCYTPIGCVEYRLTLRST